MKTIAYTSDLRAKLAGYVELTKPRIALMVLLSVAVAAILNGIEGVVAWKVVHVVIGVLFIASSGSIWNQYIERYSDFWMNRTKRRPLPRGELTSGEVTQFGTITFAIGVVYLAVLVNVSALIWGVISWVLYVLVYTPMKRLTWMNTIVGAVAGALPVVIGAAATGKVWTLETLKLFLVLFWWQFPHFMAIAWKYRDDYQAGGLKMLTNVEPSGFAAGLLAVVTAFAMGLCAILPFTFSEHRTGQWLIWFLLLLAICLPYLYFSIRFFQSRTLERARRLLRYSLIVLPAYFALELWFH